MKFRLARRRLQGRVQSRRWRIRWVVRLATAATVALGVIAAAAQPAAAAPPKPPPQPHGPTVGSTPTADGPVAFPAAAQPANTLPASVVGPLAMQIFTEAADTERLGEQLKDLDDQVAAATVTVDSARTAWQQAQSYLATVQSQADAIAAQAYQQAEQLGPFAPYANDLQQLGQIAPAVKSEVDGVDRPSGRDSLGSPLQAAQAAEQSAHDIYNQANEALAEVTARRDLVNEQFTLHQSALKLLRERNAVALAQAEAARDTFETSLNAANGVSVSVDGTLAGPKAIQAMEFALAQIGKPYEWAAEGPNSYDCSGLVFAAYLSVGIHMPRVAADQYWAGTPVLVSQLLPGDLLFFSTDKADWRQIHHVAMYIGNGKMVEAPTVGENVKISPIWWSEFFGATRMVPALTGQTTKPKPSPSATPTPTSSPSPSVTPTPTPTPTDSPTPTATATPTPTDTPTPTTSTEPPPTSPPPTSPPPSPDPTPTASPTTTASPDPTPSATSSPGPSGSALPDAVLGATALSTQRRRWWRRRQDRRPS